MACRLHGFVFRRINMACSKNSAPGRSMPAPAPLPPTAGTMRVGVYTRVTVTPASHLPPKAWRVQARHAPNRTVPYRTVRTWLIPRMVVRRWTARARGYTAQRTPAEEGRWHCIRTGRHPPNACSSVHHKNPPRRHKPHTNLCSPLEAAHPHSRTLRTPHPCTCPCFPPAARQAPCRSSLSMRILQPWHSAP